MVMEIVSIPEYQDRLDYLLGRARISAAAASREMTGGEIFLASLLRRDRPPKVIDPQKSGRIATFLAGRGRLIDDPELLLKFLLGLENDYNAVLRGRDSNPQPSGVGVLVPMNGFSSRPFFGRRRHLKSLPPVPEKRVAA